jgi:small subunit ribosomal protein S1
MMEQKDLAPWEVPPDEAYWHALLQEGEYGEGLTSSANAVRQEANPGLGARSLFPNPAPATTKKPQPAASSTPDDSPGTPDHLPGTLDDPIDTPDDVPGTLDNPTDTPDDPRRGDPWLEPEPPPLIDTPEPANEIPACWKVFAQHQAEGQLIDLPVESYNRGGLLVRWNGVVGFVPASQLCDGLRYGDERGRLNDLAARVGHVLSLRVIEVDAGQNRLIFSERAARHIEEPNLGILADLNAGDVCHGQITNLCTFGAFVDLGGVEGLIHISELSWGRVAHPADVLQSGQEVDVYVLNVDRAQGRVGLSLKRLQPDPWNSVEERYQVGQVVEGTVTNIVNFGAFVRLEEGLEGLIHASELGGPSGSGIHSLREGDLVMVRINSIEGSRHRIGLSLD